MKYKKQGRPRKVTYRRPGIRASKPPLARMLRIHELLIARKFPNSDTLALDLEVSTKTVRRDVEFMRDQLQLPVDYDPIERGFFYSKHVKSFPTVLISEGELVALLVAQKAIEQYRGTPFEKPIASAFEKLAGGMGEKSGVSLHDLVDAVSFKPASLAVSELEGFATAAECVMKEKEIEFDYAGIADEAPRRRRLHPYHLGCIADQWYLIGFDPERGAMRTFALARAHHLRPTGGTFSKPASFSPADVLGGSFSVFEAREVREVRILLAPVAARLAAERKWHESQKLVPRPDGKAELSLRVGIAPDLVSWILSWGPQAEVLEPADLRAAVARAHREASARYR